MFQKAKNAAEVRRFCLSVFLASLQPILTQIAHASKTVELQARLESKINAVDQIKESFGKYSIEAPDLLKKIEGQSERIRIIRDKEIKSAFELLIHRDLDGDRDKIWPIGKERQRNEIKGYQGSDDTLKGYKNQTHLIKWHLKIEETFKITKEFCHFFQLKAVGTHNVDAPILTLSGVIRKRTPQLQLQCWNGDKSERHFLADWEACQASGYNALCNAYTARRALINSLFIPWMAPLKVR